MVLSVDVASGVFEAEVSLTLTWQDERLRDKSLNSCAAYWPFVEAAAADAEESLVWDAFEALDGPGFFNALSVTSLDLGAGGRVQVEEVEEERVREGEGSGGSIA